jgi:predicted Zn-dependent peptidase
MSSRLFVEVREKRGLAYSISCSYKALHDTGLFLVRAGVDNQKIVEAMTLVFRELDKIKRLGVNQSEFQRAREYLLGQLLLGLEDTMDHMLWLGDSLISKDETKTLKSIIKIFEKIKKEDIKRVAKDVLNARSYNLAVVGPVTAQQEKQLAGLLTV